MVWYLLLRFPGVLTASLQESKNLSRTTSFQNETAKQVREGNKTSILTHPQKQPSQFNDVTHCKIYFIGDGLVHAASESPP
jgi:hypothetical protein